MLAVFQHSAESIKLLNLHTCFLLCTRTEHVSPWPQALITEEQDEASLHVLMSMKENKQHDVDGSSPYLGCSTLDFLQRSSTELPQAGSLLEAHLEFCSNDGRSAAALGP